MIDHPQAFESMSTAGFAMQNWSAEAERAALKDEVRWRK